MTIKYKLRSALPLASCFLLFACGQAPLSPLSQKTPVASTNSEQSAPARLETQGSGLGSSQAAAQGGPLFTGGEGYLTELDPGRLELRLNYRTPMGGMFVVQNGQIALDIDIQAQADSSYTVGLTDLHANKSYTIPGMQYSAGQLYTQANGQNLSFSFAQPAPGTLQLSSSLMMGHTLTLQRY